MRRRPRGSRSSSPSGPGWPRRRRTARSARAAPRRRGRPARRAGRRPPIRHVWIIDLENESFGYTFGTAGHKQAPYLTRTLPSQGALLSNYYGIGHDSLDNYIAQISGQAPDYQTGQDCEFFEQFIQFGGENFDKWTKYGQLSGDGCVYPRYVRTIANQLTAPPDLAGLRAEHGHRPAPRRHHPGPRTARRAGTRR